MTVGSGLPPKFPQKYKYKIIREYDVPSANLKQHWAACHQFMEQAIESGGVVLVHCYAGVSRSSSTVISYLMRKYGLSLQTAIEHTRSCRWFINPNPGFVRQLRSFERELDKKRGGPGQGARDSLPFTAVPQKTDMLMIRAGGRSTASVFPTKEYI